MSLRSIVLSCAALGALASAPACSEKPAPASGATAPAAPAPAAPTSAPVADGKTGPGIDRPQTGLPHGTVVFESKKGEVAVDVEIAANDDQRRIGLMFRRRLDPGQGMIFLMPTERQQIFWMKNTLIPLDMVFVNNAMRVVGVVEETEPLTLSGRGVPEPSRYVIELPGGFAGASGIAAGDRMRAEGIAGIP
ncbi:MAG: DUF192 domain-containing protein [Myxococcota bacterium]